MNTELFRQINEIISARPEKHDQATWESQSPRECGTARCVAGWAVYLTTGEPLLSWQPGEDIRLSDATVELAHDKGVYVEHPGDSVTIPRLAAKLLGLTRDEAASLFYSDDLPARWAVEKAAAGDRDGFLLVLTGGGEDA